MTTLETLSTIQIETIMSEAASAGDNDMVDDCRIALSGSAMTARRTSAYQRIVDAINYVEAQS
jgi:hypothetical protein